MFAVGVTTRIDVPAQSNEEQYAQACMHAKDWMMAKGGDPDALVEPFLEEVQSSTQPGPAAFGTTWPQLESSGTTGRGDHRGAGRRRGRLLSDDRTTRPHPRTPGITLSSENPALPGEYRPGDNGVMAKRVALALGSGGARGYAHTSASSTNCASYAATRSSASPGSMGALVGGPVPQAISMNSPSGPAP